MERKMGSQSICVTRSSDVMRGASSKHTVHVRYDRYN
jgi:hypothetical protein